VANWPVSSRLYLKNNNIEQEDNFMVKTLSGDLLIETNMDEEANRFTVRVNMGKPVFEVKKLINTDKERFLQEKITIDGKEIEISYILMGTDHSVIFVDDFSEYDIDDINGLMEEAEIFSSKNSASIMFSKNHRISIYEGYAETNTNRKVVNYLNEINKFLDEKMKDDSLYQKSIKKIKSARRL